VTILAATFQAATPVPDAARVHLHHGDPMSRIVPGAAPAAVDAADGVVLVDPRTGRTMWPYASPDGRSVNVTSTMGVLFSDDFGGAALDTSRWTVIDGGQGAVILASGAQQGAIGTGTGMIASGGSVAVANSKLTVTTVATSGAEVWIMSNQVFAGSEDLLFIASRTSPNANGSCFIGLVEVDGSGAALLNGNLAGDFANRGGVELGKTSGASAVYNVEAVADSSSTVASSSSASAGAAVQTLNSLTEFFVEFEAVDIIASTAIPDAIGGRNQSPARVSSQCPNDGKQYRLLIRVKNTGAAAATTYVFSRVLMKDGQEFRTEVSSGRGDQVAQKAVAVNKVQGGQSYSAFHLDSAATTNGTLVKSTPATIVGGVVSNGSAAAKHLKLYDKSTAPTVGTDAPFAVITVPAGDSRSILDALAGSAGYKTTNGLGIGITGALADSDTTAVAVHDVNLNLFYL
jgi:hypothetical protein